ncbi:MAG: hypothetical protein R3293_23060 [Candidatus Promineifilaceae bacterium]|nr:hypothetical protein [Candidatus Promineifilaceae bacterium]
MTDSIETSTPPEDVPSPSAARLIGLGPGHILLFALIIGIFQPSGLVPINCLTILFGTIAL